MQPEQDVENAQPSPSEAFNPVTGDGGYTGNYFVKDEVSEQSTTVEDDDEAVVWQASEFSDYEKSAGWYLVVFSVLVVLLLLTIFVIKSWTFAALVVVTAITVAVVSRRPPHIVGYSLSAHKITIDERHFDLAGFKYFGVVREGAFYSVRLVSHKRFMPMVSVYLPQEQAEQIVDIFGAVLPMREINLSAIDRFSERIRF